MPRKKKPITPIYQRNAAARYKAKFKQLCIAVTPEYKEKVLQAAGEKGLKAYITDLIDRDLRKKGLLADDK